MMLKYIWKIRTIVMDKKGVINLFCPHQDALPLFVYLVLTTMAAANDGKRIVEKRLIQSGQRRFMRTDCQHWRWWMSKNHLYVVPSKCNVAFIIKNVKRWRENIFGVVESGKEGRRFLLSLEWMWGMHSLSQASSKKSQLKGAEDNVWYDTD